MNPLFAAPTYPKSLGSAGSPSSSSLSLSNSAAAAAAVAVAVAVRRERDVQVDAACYNLVGGDNRTNFPADQTFDLIGGMCYSRCPAGTVQDPNQFDLCVKLPSAATDLVYDATNTSGIDPSLVQALQTYGAGAEGSGRSMDFISPARKAITTSVRYTLLAGAVYAAVLIAVALLKGIVSIVKKR
jgi:hypothetical protein